MASWFQNIASSAKLFADELADSLMAQATAAQEEITAEQNKIRREKELATSVFTLPWEPADEAHSILSQPLMAQILLLSLHESNFTSPVPDAPFPAFHFETYIPIAMELLKYDSNLVHIHTKLSPKMNEAKFWQNYYERCMLLRYSCGMEGQAGVDAVKHIDVSSVVNVTDGPTPSISPVIPASPITARDVSPMPAPAAEEAVVVPELSEEELAAAALQAEREAEEALLRAEVEAELDGHGDTDYDFSSEFEELGMDDIDDTDDAELEAQIARELMEDS